MQEIESWLRKSAGTDEGSLAAPPTESDLLGSVQLKGNRDEQISQIGSLVGKEKEYKPIPRLRREIKKCLNRSMRQNSLLAAFMISCKMPADIVASMLNWTQRLISSRSATGF